MGDGSVWVMERCGVFGKVWGDGGWGWSNERAYEVIEVGVG